MMAMIIVQVFAGAQGFLTIFLYYQYLKMVSSASSMYRSVASVPYRSNGRIVLCCLSVFVRRSVIWFRSRFVTHLLRTAKCWIASFSALTRGVRDPSERCIRKWLDGSNRRSIRRRRRRDRRVRSCNKLLTITAQTAQSISPLSQSTVAAL